MGVGEWGALGAMLDRFLYRHFRCRNVDAVCSCEGERYRFRCERWMFHRGEHR